MKAARWDTPRDIEEGEPRSPYAHWWFDQTRLPSDHGASDGVRPEERLRFLALGRTAEGAIRGRVLPLDPAGLGKGRCIPDLACGCPPDKVRAEHDGLAALLGPDPVLMPFHLDPKAANAAPADDHGWSKAEASADGLKDAPDTRVIVAVIDDGIGFANERFRTEAGRSRFDYVWVQGATPTGRGDLPFGREVTGREIDRWLAEGTDELTIYRRAGLVDPRRSIVQSALCRASHGTAVADRAAGFAPSDPAAEGITLIGVCLPSAVTHDTSGAFLDPFVILAVERILARTQWLETELKRTSPLPLVVNFSYALTAGAKDGRSGALDRYLANVRERRGSVEFVLPAGNHRQDQTRARLRRDETITWRLPPDDRTASFVEIWQPRKRQPKVPGSQLHLTAPGGGEARPGFDRFGSYADFRLNGRRAARCYCAWCPEDTADGAGRGHERLVLVMPPNAGDARRGGEDAFRGFAGDWRIRLAGQDQAGPADLYVQRDDTPFGYRQRGRQSRFVDPDYARWAPNGRPLDDDDGNGRLTRRGTVNGIATGAEVTVVAGMRLADGSSAPYSGLPGPVATTPVLTPAIADISALHDGVIVAGTFSGSSVAVSGTSMAAPRHARARAEALRDAASERAGTQADAATEGWALPAEPRRHPAAHPARIAPDRHG